MDTTLNFVLGSVSSLGVILLGIGIYTILKMNKRIKELEKSSKTIDDLKDRIDGNFNANHNSIDSLRRIITEDISTSVSSTRSYIDSRLDKLISNISNEISEDRKSIESIRNLLEQVAIDHSERLATLETFKKIDDDKIEQINS
jgi:prefoldin subunit 5